MARDFPRMQVRIRDKYTCQGCGITRTPDEAAEQGKKMLHVHHMNGLCGVMTKKYDSVKDLAGLITICEKCHANRHDLSERRKGSLFKSKVLGT